MKKKANTHPWRWYLQLFYIVGSFFTGIFILAAGPTLAPEVFAYTAQERLIPLAPLFYYAFIIFSGSTLLGFGPIALAHRGPLAFGDNQGSLVHT